MPSSLFQRLSVEDQMRVVDERIGRAGGLPTWFKVEVQKPLLPKKKNPLLDLSEPMPAIPKTQFEAPMSTGEKVAKGAMALVSPALAALGAEKQLTGAVKAVKDQTEAALEKGPLRPGFGMGMGLTGGIEGADLSGRAVREELTGEPYIETGNLLADVTLNSVTDPLIVGSALASKGLSLAALPFLAGRQALMKSLRAKLFGKGAGEVVKRRNIVKDAIEDFVGNEIKRTPKPPAIAPDFQLDLPGDLSLKMIGETGELVKPGKYAFNVNLDRLDIDDAAKLNILAAVDEMEKVKGKVLTHDEILETAARSDILREAIPREHTLKMAAALTRTRQHMAGLAEGVGISPELIEATKVVSSEAAEAGRLLNSFKISAEASPLQKIKDSLIKDLKKIGVDADEIVDAAKGIDFTDEAAVTKFYRKFVKPTKMQWLDEYRYINLLSSPRTHIINFSSNLMQASMLNPLTRLASGGTDLVLKGLTGRARDHYMREVPMFYKGMLNSFSEAFTGVREVMAGRKIIERPDLNILKGGKLNLERLPTGGSLTKLGRPITQALEAGDIFFQTLIRGGEREALAYKYLRAGIHKPMDEIEQMAQKKAAYWVFRSPVDAKNRSGQGNMLSAIDRGTDLIYKGRSAAGKAHLGPLAWVVPFVRTPMNIFKQGMEFSPLGIGTLPGAADKIEQFGKAMVGSSIFAVSAVKAWNGDVTWKSPKNPRERAEFFASGRRPFSVRFGDKWIGFSRLGPAAYPFAMAAAAQWHLNEKPELSTSHWVKEVPNALFGIVEFFADQSYVQGIGNLIDAIDRPEKRGAAMTSLPMQLIPLMSLQRWIGNIIDPVYRRTDKGFTVNAAKQSFMATHFFLRKYLPAYETPDLEEAPRKLPLLNAVSPIDITPEEMEHEEQLTSLYEMRGEHLRRDAIDQDIAEEIDEMAKPIAKEWRKLSPEELYMQYGILKETQPEIASRAMHYSLTSTDAYLRSSDLGLRSKFVIQALLTAENLDKQFLDFMSKGIITNPLMQHLQLEPEWDLLQKQLIEGQNEQ